MMDRLDERVQIIKNLLKGGKIVFHRTRQRVSKQRISKRVPVRYQNDASLESVAEYDKERRFQITLRMEETQCQG